MTVQDLRDVLRERAAGPSPANPHRHDEVRARIRRTRLRRRAVAGGVVSVVSVVAAVVVTVALLPGTAEEPAATTVTAEPAPGLPERYTAPDGTVYRRLAATRLVASGVKTSVTVPVTGNPLDVAARCDGEMSAPPRILVNGRNTGPQGFAPCPKDMDLRPLIVPADAKEVTVTFDRSTSGGGCVTRTKNGPCEPVKPQRSGWDLAVYEWIPPARMILPEPVRAMPERLAGKKLLAQFRGVWPGRSTFEMQVVGTGDPVGIDQICSGALAGRMWFTYQIDGQESPTRSGCGIWKEGPFPTAMEEFTVPKGKRVTVTGRVGLWGESTNRPVNWAIGVYRR
ncbi:hypothetical protein AB0M50_38125 [Nonomuraea fuscirosea]|uniref:hypothetical protein n=1 Tax=Nonomuraea fuscirosea TaxID=1291556 RepID=UPI0034345614